MAETIKSSVGKNGKNQLDDVIKVQKLLLQHGFKIGTADGLCGPRTIGGITTFQHAFLRTPDGRVDPEGKTWQRLNLIAYRPTPTAGIAPKVTSPQAIAKAVPSEVPSSVTTLVRRDSLGPLNVGLTAVNNRYMVEKLGKPRESFSADCQPITNVNLKKFIKSESVGPFRVTGLSPAIDSLRSILMDISRMHPEIYAALGTAGMLCCRYVRGSTSSISNHSWGTAIDLTLKGVLDRRGDGMVQHGLAVIAPIFNMHQWYWGAGFPTEDAMHFEVSKALMESWLPKLK